MDTLVGLSIGVFALGAVLCAFFMVFLLRGKPIAGSKGDRQIVKYKALELQTNSIMLLLIVSVLVAVSPLALHGWLRLKEPLSKKPLDGEATIYLQGELRDSVDPATKLAETPLTATNIGTRETVSTQSDQEGHFDFDGIRITSQANRIRLVIDRDGYSRLEKMIVANEQVIPLTLTKKPSRENQVR
jgi:hypothetical protein